MICILETKRKSRKSLSYFFEGLVFKAGWGRQGSKKTTIKTLKTHFLPCILTDHLKWQ